MCFSSRQHAWTGMAHGSPQRGGKEQDEAFRPVCVCFSPECFVRYLSSPSSRYGALAKIPTFPFLVCRGPLPHDIANFHLLVRALENLYRTILPSFIFLFVPSGKDHPTPSISHFSSHSCSLPHLLSVLSFILISPVRKSHAAMCARGIRPSPHSRRVSLSLSSSLSAYV